MTDDNWLLHFGMAVGLSLPGYDVDFEDNTLEAGSYCMKINKGRSTYLIGLLLDPEKNKVKLVNTGEDLGTLEDSPAIIAAKVKELPPRDGTRII